MPLIEQHSVANHLLAALPSADFARLAPTLEPVDFTIQQTLFPAEEEIKAAYCVETGVITMLARFEDGSLAEVGLIGREGMAGLPLVFGTAISPVEAIAEVPGRSLRVAAPAFQQALKESPALLACFCATLKPSTRRSRWPQAVTPPTTSHTALRAGC